MTEISQEIKVRQCKIKSIRKSSGETEGMEVDQEAVQNCDDDFDLEPAWFREYQSLPREMRASYYR